MAKKGGRPLIDIDKEDFEGLCGIQCTKDEIADFFDCSEDTIERWCKRTYKKRFAEVFRRKRGVGRVSLRRKQFRMAGKSAAMAIWLGKQYLGQSDNANVIKQEVNPVVFVGESDIKK